MKDSDLYTILHSLDMVVMERIETGLFRLLGSAPDWFRSICPEVDSNKEILQPGERFDYLNHFLMDAEDFWVSEKGGKLRSGIWIETDPSGNDLALEATVLNAGKSKIMIIELGRYSFNEKQHIIQTGRDLQLAYDRLERLERALRKANQELQSLNQLKNKFLGMAAHDLRNPLVSIGGFTQLMLDGDFGPVTEDQKEFLALIKDTSYDMLNLVNDLLDISVIESGKLDLNLKPGSLKDLITKRLRIIGPVAEKKEIIIHEALAHIPEVVFDSNRISQAIDNLISNAVKFSPPGSNIYVILAEEDQRAKFSVRDEGPGIPVEEQSKLFGEFQPLSTQPTGGEKSTGLGLSITKKIVEAHGGSIGAQSQVGAGSTFIILLPLGDSQ